MNIFKKYNLIIKSALFSFLVFLGSFNFTSGWDGNGLLGWMGELMLWISSQILAISGILFNVSLEYTLNFKYLVEQTGVVNIGWQVIRDFSNMLFIFVLLFLSIGTILGLSSYNVKNSIKNIILAALLINFSLFFTNVIIDVSNVAAVGFYNATIQNTTKEVGGFSIKGSTLPSDKGISSVFSQALKISTIYDGTKMTAEGVDAHRNIFTIALFGSIFLLITAFVFLSAAIMFLIRTVTLMILMMISPIAFIGMVLPNTSGYAKQWWSELLHQSMFAPIYMMFIYITATAINTPGFKAVLANTGNGNNFASLFTGGGAVTVVFNFILIIGLLLGALISAKSLGAKGANFATEKAGAGLGKLAFGTSAWLGRRTLGAGASRIADWGAKQDMATTGMGKFALKQLRNVGDNSFDARNNKTFRETAGNLPGGGIKLGEGRKGGYTTIAKEVQKEQTKYGQSLGKNTKDIKLSEVYGEKIKDHSIISSILGETAGNIKASKSLLDLPKHEKSLTEAKTKLKEMEKKDSSSTPEEVVKQENTIEELKEKIQKIKDSIKDK